MEFLTLGAFCASIILSMIFHFSILYALAAGWFLFMLYGLWKKHSLPSLLRMSMKGVKTVKGIMITFLIIGVMTALWRASGTIPVIVAFAYRLIRPSVFVLLIFILNSFIAFLIGTSFGTAATMGVICATIGRTMGISDVIIGGAVLSGAFFGDRCSPLSTSAMLVAELTETNLYDNIRNMVKSALVPTVLTCIVYLVIGLFVPHAEVSSDVLLLFEQGFVLSPVALLPAALILLLALLRIPVKRAMLASIVVSVPICLIVQHQDPAALFKACILGYKAADPELGAMINGGGIASFIRTILIVVISSTYSGIFEGTGLLDFVQNRIRTAAEHLSDYPVILLTSLASGMIACNQTLTVMLVNQLCLTLKKDKYQFALDIEDSAILVAALVPWSIACATPLTMVSAPMSSIFLAVYLYLMPLWRVLKGRLDRR